MSAELPVSSGATGASAGPGVVGTGAAPRDVAPLAPQSVVGDYLILERLSHGGMGMVYKARHRVLGRVVALKTVLTGQVASEEEFTRFRTEAEAVALLEHPHIIPIYEAGEHAGVPFFTMRLVEGRNLAAWRAEEGGGKPGAPASLGKPWVRRVVRIMITVTRAVHHVHEQRILHRDLKPSNVLVDGEDRPYVTDFGLARLLRHDSDLTLTGAMLGTPNYMSPEQAQAQNREVSFTADVFSLGAMLYELLTGKLAFQGDNALAVLKQVVEGDPSIPSLLNPHVDPDLETICLKCLEKDPKRRYAFAEELARDLERWERHEPISARRAGALERGRKWIKRRPLAAALAGFLVVSLVGFGLTMAHSQARLRKERDATVQQKVKSLIREGESYLANDRIAEAKQKVFEARELARGRGWSTLSADLALLEIYRRSPPELMVLQAHEGPVRCLAVSVEGRDVYSGGADGMLRWWSMPAGRLAGVWPAHPGGVTALARSRDGRFLVSGGAGGAMRVWDLRKPGGSRTLTSHSNTIASLVFSPQGEVLASADSDGWVHLWHGHTYEHLRAVQTTERELRGVVFGTNTLQVASAYGFGVRFWDLATGQGGNRVLSAGGCLAFVSSPDGSVVFLSNAAGVISQRDLLGREIAGTQIQLNVPCPGLAVSGSLGRVAVGGADGSLRVWDHTTRPMERVVALYGHQGAVNGVAFLEAAEVLVSAGDDGTVRFWKIRPEQALIFQARPNSEMHRARFLSGDLMVLAGNEGGYANLWDAVTGKLLQVFVGHEGWVYDVVGTPDARTVYSGGMDGTIRAWQTTTGREVWRRGPELAGGLVNVRPVRGLALSPDAECLVAGLDSLTNPGSGSDAGVLVALASETGSVLTNFVAHERGILAVAFSPDQRKVATVGRDGWLKLWNRADWRLLGTLPGMAIDANQIVFSTDGHRGYSVAASGAPLAWDTESHRLIGSFTRSPARCVSVALSADNALLLGGTASGELTLWDPVTRAELRTFQLGPSARTVHALGFAERTRRVAAGGRLLQLWDFDQGSSLSAAQEPAAADRVKSAADPASGRTMLRLAGWYALRGSWDWATDLYQQAREQGALVRDLDLARCLWQQGQLDSAVAQLESAAGQAPEVYLELCRNAIQGEIASQQPPDYELPVPAGAIVAPSRPEVWKDIWTTSVLAYSDVTETPGGGKADEILRVGGSRDDYESLLQMEVAGLPERAASAQLYLFCREVVGYSNAMYLERITADWDWRIRGTGPDLKRLWYQDKPPSEPWGEQPLPGPLPGRWYPIDITRLYNAWKSGQLPNHGVLLRPTFTKNETFNLFYSSRHRHDPGLWPRLVIVPATE